MAARWTRWVRRTALSNLLAAALGALLAFGLQQARQMNAQPTAAVPPLVHPSPRPFVYLGVYCTHYSEPCRSQARDCVMSRLRSYPQP